MKIHVLLLGLFLVLIPLLAAHPGTAPQITADSSTADSSTHYSLNTANLHVYLNYTGVNGYATTEAVLVVQHSAYDSGDNVNFTLYTDLILGSTPGTGWHVNITISGAGIHTYYNESFLWQPYPPYTGRTFNLIPAGSGDTFWSMVIYSPLHSSKSITGLLVVPVNPDPNGTLTLSASLMKIYISQHETLSLVSTIAGGTQPWESTWYENGNPVITGSGLNSSYSPSFSLPGNYTFRAVAYDSAGAGPVDSNNVTVTVYGLPSEDFIHSGIPVANSSYEMEFSIQSPVQFAQKVTMPNGSVYSGGDNVTLNYSFSTAGIKTIRSEIFWNGSAIENMTFDLTVGLNVAIVASTTSGLSPLNVHFSPDVQGSSHYNYSWILMPGITSNLSSPSETYLYGNWTVSLEVSGSNNTTGSAFLVIRSGLSAIMQVYPEVSTLLGTVYLNASVISNYSIDHVYAGVTGLSGFFNVTLNLTGTHGTNHSYSATMDEFNLLAGNYSVDITAISSSGMVTRSSSEFVVNFSFAQVTIEPNFQISGGLLNLTVTAISSYTVKNVQLQVSGPSGITDYNLTLTAYTGDTSTWILSIDEYSLGNGAYSALISAHNSRGFTDFSTFPFNVMVPGQGFSFGQFISDIGGPISFLTLMGVIVMAIGVAVGVGTKGTETIYIGGQKYKAKAGKPLKRMKGGKK